MPPPPNLLADLPAPGAAESFETLLTAAGFRVERIVSRGHASPPGFWYDGPEDEWVLLVAGAARLTFEGDPEPVALTPGSHLHIPARRRHRVDWTAAGQPTVWLAIHFAAGSAPVWRRHAGAVRSGAAGASDNARIDADLAREHDDPQS